MTTDGGGANERGLWIALEGGEGSGKSTQCRILGERFGAVVTREPGGTDTGQAIRNVVLSPDFEVSPRAEALLMAADRAHHLSELVEPALASGQVVVSDRSVASSLAYQGYGRGLGVDEVRRLNQWALGERWPDVFVLLRVPRPEAQSRMPAERDRIERASPEFFARVDQGFAELADADPERWVVVDASGSVDEVTERIISGLAERGLLRSTAPSETDASGRP